ncbi:MAG: hypothetical protein KDD44_12740, partial [Bdellovibrionales bacterium]|nr:hypothetical protein [Bdellovibrionales bacterium]
MKKVFVALSIVALAPVSAHACRCEPLPLEEQFHRAGAVFIARVLRAVPSSDQPSRTASFTVVGRPFKGDPKPIEGLISASTSAACGVDLVAGATYLVFTTSHPDFARRA